MQKRRIAESRKNVIHPSGEVIFAEWYPPPLMVPKPLVEEKRALILDLNGLLVHVVEPWQGEVLPEWEEELDKYYMEGGRVVLCHKDNHRFLDWCLQFFHVYVWSTSRGRKVNAILNQVFSQQRVRMGGELSQEHCARWHWTLYEKPIFFKHLSQFWRGFPQFGPTNTLIIDDSKYKVFQNPKGSWLVFPKMEV